MKKLIVSVVLLAAVAAGGYGYYRYSKRPTPPTVTTAAVTRGDVVESVSATGTLQAVTTVQVGSQVSGNISFLGADFNSIVKKGQVLARLDPSLFEAQAQQQRANLAQARANFQRSQSDLERVKVQQLDAQQKYARANELSSRNLLAKSDLDAAKTALDTAKAAVESQQATVTQMQASITQAEASVNQTQVNLEHTVITSPIDGLVISRSVDVGQTVAASMQAPTLFVLAADLTKMQVVANLDESDVGRIRPNQTVTFRVDAYPTQTFRGTVSQVRLEPKVQQNVVTYATVIDVPNDNLLLKPGMTANVDVEISKATNVLRIPNSALRFRPSNDVFTAFGQTPPEPQRRGFGGGNGGGRGGAPGAASSSGSASEIPSSSAPSASAAAAPAATTARDKGNAASPAREPQGTRASASGEGSGAPSGQAQSARAQAGTAPSGSSVAPSGGRGAGPGAGDTQANEDSSSDRRSRFAERLQNMSPEEREAAMARMRERGIDPNNPGAGFGRRGGFGGPDAQNAGDAAAAGRFGRGGNPGANGDAQTARSGRGGGPGQASAQVPAGAAASGRSSGANATASANAARRSSPAGTTAAAGATTIDALFAPLSHPTSRGAVWLFVNNKLERVPLSLGVSDGQNTELVDGNVTEGTEVVTNVAIAGQTTRPATTAFPGFGGAGGRQGFPGGGFGGGGNGGGRGR